MGNTPSSIPYNAQYNQVHTTLTCLDLYNFDNVPPVFLETYLSVTAPLTASVAYLSNITASIELPQKNAIYGAKVNIEFAVAGASSLYLSRSVYTIPTDSIELPGVDGNLTAQPPITLGPINVTETARYSIGRVNFTLSYKEGSDRTFVCYQQVGTIGSIVPGEGLQAPSAAPQFPATPPDSKTTIANLPLDCSTQNGKPAYNLTIGGVTPHYATGSLRITQFTAFITIPAAEVDKFIKASGHEQIDLGILINKSEYPGSLAGLGFNITNATPALYDLADGSYVSTDPNYPKYLTPNYKTEGGDLTLAIPLDGSLSLGPFSLGSGVFSASPLGLYGLVAVSDGSVSQQLACAVQSALELFSTTIINPIS